MSHPEGYKPTVLERIYAVGDKMFHKWLIVASVSPFLAGIVGSWMEVPSSEELTLYSGFAVLFHTVPGLFYQIVRSFGRSVEID